MQPIVNYLTNDKNFPAGKFVNDLIDNAANSVNSGLSKAAELPQDVINSLGSQTGDLGVSDLIKSAKNNIIPLPFGAEGKVDNYGKIGELTNSLLKTATGLTQAGFSAASVAVPEMAAYTAGSEAIKQNADKFLPEYEANYVKNVVDIPFSAVTKTAEALGFNPKNHENWAMLMQLGDLAAVAYGAKAYGDAKNPIKSVKDFQDLSAKASNGELSPEEMKKYQSIADQTVDLNDIEKSAKEKGALNIVNEINNKENNTQPLLQVSPELKSLNDKLSDLKEDKEKMGDNTLQPKIDELQTKIDDATQKSVLNHASDSQNEVMLSDIDSQIKYLESKKESLSDSGKEEIDNTIDQLNIQKGKIKNLSYLGKQKEQKLFEEKSNNVDAILKSINNADYINENELNNSSDHLYDILDKVEKSDLPDEQKKSATNLIEPLINKIEKYEFRTKTKISTVTEGKTTLVPRENKPVEKIPALEQSEGADVEITKSNGDKVRGIISNKDGSYVVDVKGGNQIVLGEKAITDRDLKLPSEDKVENPIAFDKDGNVESITFETHKGDLITIKGHDKAIDLAIQLKADIVGDVPQPLFDQVYSEVQKGIQYEEIVNTGEKITDKPKAETTPGVTVNPSGEVSAKVESKPVEKPTSKVENADNKNTGLKNALQRNLPEIKLSKLGNADENLKIGKDLIESGKVDPKEVVKKIIDGNGNVGRTIEEDHAMQYYNRQMESKSNELDLMKADAEEEIKKNPDSVEAKENAAVIQNEIQQHNDEFTALKISNTIDSNYWGKKGLNKQVEIKPDFTAEEIHREFDNGYGGKVPEKTTKIINEAIEQRDKAQLELKRLEKERDEWKAKSEFESIKERSVKSRSKDRSLKIEDIRKERKSLLDEFKKEWKGNPDVVKQGLPITDKMVKLTAQLVDTYVREGFLKLEDVVDKIHEDLKGIIGDEISKKDVRRMIAGEYDETPEPRTKTEAQKQIEEIKKQSKLINRLEDLQSGKYESKTPKVKAEQSEEIRSLKEQIKKIFKEDFPIEVIKKNLATQESKLKNIVKIGKFIPEVKQKKIFPKDKQIIEAKQRIANAKHEIVEQRSKMLNSEGSKTQRSLNFIARWNRRRVLSGITVLGKLSGAALFNYAAYIPEELAGEFWGRVFSKIASDSEGEAYINAKASAKYFTEPFKKQRLLDAKSIYKTGTTDLNRLYGNKFSDHYAGYDALLDTHTLIKMFPHASEFASALEKMTVEAEKQGLDVSEPLMQQSLQLKAYKKANYSIFLNDNTLVKKFNDFVRGLDSKAIERGDFQLAKFTSDLLLPVKKVPANIIGRTTTYVTGVPAGLLKVRKMYAEGIETFSPEEKAAVIRQLKKGSIGGAIIVTGIIMGSKNTGLYTQSNPDKTRSKQDKSGQLNFLGFDLPHQLQHSPTMMALLSAGTFGMAYNNYYKHIDKETGKKPKHDFMNGLIATAEAAAITVESLLSNMPVISGVTELGGVATGNQESVRRFKKDWTPNFKNEENNFIPLVKDIKKLRQDKLKSKHK